MTRFYENIYPQVGNYVMTQIKSVTEIGAYVSLLEYDDLEGMVQLQDLTNRRVYRSTTKIGRREVLLVTRLDPEKGYIDLTKKGVTTEMIEKVEKTYSQAKCVQSIMIRVSDLLDIPLLDLHKQVTWVLYQQSQHPYDVFRHLLSNPVSDLQKLPFFDCLIDTIKKRLHIQVYHLRAMLDVGCFSHHGVDGIKAAIKEGEKLSEEVSITLDKSPSYFINLETTEKDEGVDLLYRVISTIDLKIREYGGWTTLQSPPIPLGEDVRKSGEYSR